MFGGYPPTAIGYPPTAIGYPPTAIGYTPTAINYPPTAIGYTPTAISYPPAAIIGRIGHSEFFFLFLLWQPLTAPLPNPLPKPVPNTLPCLVPPNRWQPIRPLFGPTKSDAQSRLQLSGDHDLYSGGGGVGTRPWCQFVRLWRRLLASRPCTF